MSHPQEFAASEDQIVAEHFGYCSPPALLPREWFGAPFHLPDSVAWLFCTGCLQLFEVDGRRVGLLQKLAAVPPGYDGPISPPVLPEFDPATHYFLAVGGCPTCREGDLWIDIRIETPEGDPEMYECL